MAKSKKEKPVKQDYESLTAIVKNVWFILRIALKEAPFYTIHQLTSKMMHEIIVFIEHVYMIGFIITCIEQGKPFWHAAVFVITVFIVLRIIQIIGNIYVANYKPKGQEKIYRRLRMELYNKASKIDLECYDNPKFYNEFVWAMNDMPERFEQIMMDTANILGGIVGVIVMGTYMLAVDWIGILFIIVSFSLTIWMFGKFNKHQVALDLATKPLIRKRDYINRVFYLADFAKEIRTGNIKRKMYEDFNKANDDISKEADKRTKWMPWLAFTAQFGGEFLLFSCIYILYLLYMAIIQKSISFGTAYTLFGAAENTSNCMTYLAKTIPNFIKHSMYIDKIRKFLDYDIKIKDKAEAKDVPERFHELVLKNVSYAYSQDAAPILKNINMHMKRGEKIALVGYNGAGKTTLVKLLMRLYDVSSGEIQLDGTNIVNYKVDRYRHQFGTVFQDYQLFAASICENVAMDKVQENEKTVVEHDVKAALVNSGFADKLANLAKGIDTPLTREFDEEGTNLSGGESQKIAIARVLYKDCPIIILDEPTSALDPISEYNLNNTMRNMSEDKTVIFISHRLSTTKMADRIYMLEEGEIVECGTHLELLELNGKYAEMFNLQAEKYR